MQVLELAGPEAVLPVLRPLFRTLAKCVGSTHFQVAERALFLWNNEHLLTHGILSRTYATDVLPLLYSALQKNAVGHWNQTVETLAQNVLKHYNDADPALYDRCAAAATSEPAEKVASETARRTKWEVVDKMAAASVAAGISTSSYTVPVTSLIGANGGAGAGGGGTGAKLTTSGGRPLSVSTLAVLNASAGSSYR